MRFCSRCGKPDGPGNRIANGKTACYPCRDRYRKATEGVEPPSPEMRRLMRQGPDRAAFRSPDNTDMKRLVAALGRGPVGLMALCDKLDMSPARVRKLLEEAQADGLQIEVANDHAGLRQPREPDFRDVQRVGVKPVKSTARVGVISDTHLGSKHCLRAQLVDFVEECYRLGVREILHAGDITDGDYRHGKFEASHVGLDEQVRDWCETLPEKPGLTYHAITGNHDFTFTEASGVSVGRAIESRRRDFRCYGDRGAFLEIHGAVVHLWHPRSGGAYAVSYPLQKRVEGYAAGEKPHVLLAGHWHRYCHLYERGVHALACPTFQGGGSAFSRSLPGSPAIGGLVLEWGLTEDGTMRDFKHNVRAYFEREVPQKVVLRGDES